MARLAHVHPEGASLRYVAEQVVVSPSRVSRLAEERVARGWLERAVSPHDGRLLDRLTQKQLDSIVAVCRALGAPHC
ncbi:MAG TPA: helix-turn-helix domain-containing protein [Gaiellaceae bacterium]|jgi:DNA-binding MarR family transcriptional regulator|nr:helix-turn-helix domain-containing protein [Gaiellaceae bacterium]